MTDEFYDCFFCRKKEIVFIEKDGVFLVLTGDKKYVIELKEVSFSLWKNLKKRTSFKDLYKKIKAEYEVSEKELKKDIIDWLKQAIEEKIVEKQSKP